MTIVSAFLLPGNPLPLLAGDNPPWAELARGCRAAGEALRASRPDVLLIYSTQWLAVLDQLWQVRPHSIGTHVDENWYDYGDLDIDIRADVELTTACIASANAQGIRSRPVDYDAFPIDTATIVASRFVDPDARIPAVIAASNVYHDFAKTEAIGALVRAEVEKQGKRAAVLAIGGLSGSYFDSHIDIAQDRIANADEDRANRDLLEVMATGDQDRLRACLPAYAEAAKGDMGMKHLAWLLGAAGGFEGATVHAYGSTYGAGAAAVEFHLNG